jgi:hypothetical protein
MLTGGYVVLISSASNLQFRASAFNLQIDFILLYQVKIRPVYFVRHRPAAKMSRLAHPMFRWS